jgi:hypothetical protein
VRNGVSGFKTEENPINFALNRNGLAVSTNGGELIVYLRRHEVYTMAVFFSTSDGL